MLFYFLIYFLKKMARDRETFGKQFKTFSKYFTVKLVYNNATDV